MVGCKKCGQKFIPQKGLLNYCSLKCRNARVWSEKDKLKKSLAAKSSEKILCSNRSSTRNRKVKFSSPCKLCNKPIIDMPHKKRKYHAECWLKVSGGYRENSTIVNKCIYNGIKLDSGLEKLFAMLLDKANIKWSKNNGDVYFEYEDKKQKKRKYYPDFYLPEYDLWVETKGGLYKTLDKNYEMKINSVTNLEVLFNKDVKELYNFLK